MPIEQKNARGGPLGRPIAPHEIATRASIRPFRTG